MKCRGEFNLEWGSRLYYRLWQLVTDDENINTKMTVIFVLAGLSFGLSAKDKKLKLRSVTGLADLTDG